MSQPPIATNKRQIQARLIERGSNFRQFALEHGYKPRTVTQAVDRWTGKNTLPQGRLTYRILRELSEAAECEVVPGILAGQLQSSSPSTAAASANL